ncbi:methylmalonate-semialdehyde dehydrogenase [Aspergillus homomorphus CBS 101889]|uniref:Methylmalonate-semialdehyde dehydrogenase n=1 Tax=Aspergillus homomorphus (strain CBS 101889) TaxID=1450537 RepID=A0A395HML9_ASPHC|nr:methylmalonate-semialdehyde dehydrogenase [Aspergillus homomorphus CBS 101889]RAL08495.1 methylmalonate-semialdehyde dehydrogenase [Aspergillus homomorphus CBS 101889]
MPRISIKSSNRAASSDSNHESDAERSAISLAPPTVTHLFINNECVMFKSQSWSNVLDPVSQRLLCRVPGSTLHEVQRAVQAVRREHLLKSVDVLRQMSPEIQGYLFVPRGGQDLADADSEVFRGLDCIHVACSIGPEMAGMFLGGDATLLQTFYEPVGVCVSITPFSFPFMIPLWFLQYALITLPFIQAVSFVGSEPAARQVHDLARSAGKRVQAECGGKNHGVVLEDASTMPTLFAIAGSAFVAADQRCMALSVAVFVGSTRDWIPKLVELAESMVVGCGGDQESKIGPLIDEDAIKRVRGVIQRAVQEQAEVLLDGRQIRGPGYPDGNFLGPTILTGVETYMECYQSGMFGQVLIYMEVSTLEEAIELINQNKCELATHIDGNACSIFTTSGKHANTFRRGVNVGQIGVNIPLIAPYGTAVRTSNKDSFLGDLSTYWPFFTTTKIVSSRWEQ